MILPAGVAHVLLYSAVFIGLKLWGGMRTWWHAAAGAALGSTLWFWFGPSPQARDSSSAGPIVLQAIVAAVGLVAALKLVSYYRDARSGREPAGR